MLVAFPAANMLAAEGVHISAMIIELSSVLAYYQIRLLTSL